MNISFGISSFGIRNAKKDFFQLHGTFWVSYMIICFIMFFSVLYPLSIMTYNIVAKLEFLHFKVTTAMKKYDQYFITNDYIKKIILLALNCLLPFFTHYISIDVMQILIVATVCG